MKRLIKLKHWQIFALLCTPYIVSIIFWQENFSIGNITALEISVFAGILSLILFFSWILSIGLFLNSIPDNPHRFKKWLLIISILFCLIGYSDLNMQRLTLAGGNTPNPLSAIMTPLVFFGIFYAFYNVPKSLKSIEFDRKAKFPEWIIDALLLFIFPIGIWIIQPRLNKIYAVNEMIENEKK
ncbi:MAG: hypothetical protein JXL97_03320 [Bacteroidales bacterium]|nr:hypothetical protein [Bacteroidales bacterium]